MNETLIEFKKRLELLGLQGWLLPKSDRHLGEYSPPWEERLAHVTGFDGSAGMAIVTSIAQALFVDGRYTLQARMQVGTDLYHLGVFSPNVICQWLANQIKAGDRVGYDPWLMTSHQLAPYRATCSAKGAELVPIVPNPVDLIWEGRPPEIFSPVEVYPLEYSGQSWQEKCSQVQNSLQEAGVGATVLSLVDSVNWLFNIRATDIPYNPFALAYALVPAKGAPTLFRELSSCPSSVLDHLSGVHVVPYGTLCSTLESLSGPVGLDLAHTPAAIVDVLSAQSSVEIVDLKDPCLLAKARKNVVEVKSSHSAHRLDGAALARFFHWLEGAIGSGLTECGAQDRLEAFRRDNLLYRGPSFATIAGYGPHGAIIHYRSQEATDAVLSKDSLFLLDSGGQYFGGTTDVTRTLSLGTPSLAHKRHYTLVLKGHLALGHAHFPRGTPGYRLDPLARQFLWQEGLDYAHGTGHGVGSYLAVHEGPQNISGAPNPTALEPGMIVSNEPGYYLEGGYGIRIENLQLVVESAHQGFYTFSPLTRVPYARNLMDKELLSPQEVAWVNAYHSWVWEEVSPLLEGGALAWLRAATTPL